jgi:mRNA interferase MazF
MSKPRVRAAPWQVWWCEFNPQVGHEQAGRRPAIVVGSPRACSIPNGLVLLVPCTTKDRQLPWQPPVYLAGRQGWAMCDQVKALSADRLVNLHAAGSVVLEERDSISLALRQLIV